MIEQSKFRKLHASKAWFMGSVIFGKLATMALMLQSGTIVSMNRRAMTRLFNEASGAFLVLTGAYTLTEEDNGKIIFLNSATGFTVTLPPSLLGSAANMKFRFLIGTTPPTSGNHVIATALGSAGDDIYGRVMDLAGTGDVISAADQINFVANQATFGDEVTIEGIGLAWQVTGFAAVAAAITATG